MCVRGGGGGGGTGGGGGEARATRTIGCDHSNHIIPVVSHKEIGSRVSRNRVR